MVGDSVWDMIAARRAGIPGIGLLSGGIAQQELRDAGAAEVYADAASLLGKISGSVIGELGGRASPLA
jgi:phosphoglycolate phosphatase-like HAD superfamily hydrolase